MINIFCVLVVLAVGYALHRNGLFSSIAMLIMIVLAGVVTFNFFEPIADVLDGALRGTFLDGTEDVFALTGLFCLSLGLMRWAVNTVSPLMIEYHGYVQLAGAGIVGMFAGYLVSGFIVCVVATLPIDERFLGYEPRSAEEYGMRRFLPPDRVWLALMRHAGAYPLARVEDQPDKDTNYERFRTFDRHATWELRYWRYRRYSEQRATLNYAGEFDRELYRK
jgi:hypothetical protein